MTLEIPESSWQTTVTDLLDRMGWLWHHETDSRKSRRGFPDLVAVKGARVLFIELKTNKGRIRPEQHEWLDRLRATAVEVYVWRPADWPEVVSTLTSALA